MGTIISTAHTPYDENRQRDVIHFETQIDAVLDPAGVPLRERLDSIDKQLVPVDVSLDRSGLMTPELVAKYDSMISDGIIISSIKPSSGSTTMWFNIYDPGTTVVEPL